MTRAWLLLVLLTVTSVAALGRWESGPLAGALVLGLAWFKVRLVLDHFVGLRRAGAWRTGLLALFLGVVIVIYLPYGLSML